MGNGGVSWLKSSPERSHCQFLHVKAVVKNLGKVPMAPEVVDDAEDFDFALDEACLVIVHGGNGALHHHDAFDQARQRKQASVEGIRGCWR